MTTRYFPLSLILIAAAVTHADGPPAARRVEFNRDVRPILSEYCFQCHGPDANQRKAELRFDNESTVIADREGHRVIDRAKPTASELLKRIDPDAKRLMPPPRTGKKLKPQELAILRDWIAQGGTFEKHWSLIPPKRPELPKVQGTSNPVDAFVRARLEKAGLQPSPEADRRTLIRRLYFDLTGLPPTPDEVDAYINDKDPKAYDKLVDKLLGSQAFGERMAVYWLDVVRYSDTAGYHSDNHRDVWLFRDYVIDAFNTNKRFDQFTTEQLAGDLLPNATREQKIASGYNRLLQTTEEGGAQPKEYTAKYSADRVRNTATAWLGATMGCCECHDHKFDPFTQKDFYSFAAFFSDVSEAAVGRQAQTPLPSPAEEKKLKDLDAKLADLQKEIDKPSQEIDAAQVKWEEEFMAGKVKGLPKNIADIFAVEAAKRTPQQKQALAAHYRTIASQLVELRKQLDAVKKERDALSKTLPTTLVSMSGAPRMVRILPRGNWLSDAGAVMEPITPQSLPALGVNGRRASRLDLAKWMTSPDNPLVARVFVNRLWKLYFGQGIVRTLDDFGSQGQWPTHPELLDWLAVEFREGGWDVKKMSRLLVTSETYKQTSKVDAKLVQADPFNHLLSRQARWRLDAEMVRDNALAVSGLLVNKIGGPSVKPYQPPGYWALLNFPTREWQNDKGESLYRRGLYTYWCRTFLHPGLAAFDAPSREECTVDRSRSNTPQQALVLLNDTTYVETARVLAARVIRDGGKDASSRLTYAFRHVLQRAPLPGEVDLLQKLVAQHTEKYKQDPNAAAALLKVGEASAPQGMDPIEVAAWTSACRALLNLHETITRN